MGKDTAMKLAYYTFFGGAQNYLQQIEQAHRYGCTGLEPLSNLDLASGDPERAKIIKEKLDEYGMCVPCFSMWVTIMPDPEEAYKKICKMIDVAKILDAPYFHHTVGPVAYEGQPFSEYLATAVSVIRRTSDYAGERGMQILIEPQGMTMNGVAHLKELYDTVDRPIGAVLDTGNILTGGNTNEEYLQAFGPLVKHVHIKDMLIRDHLPKYASPFWEPAYDPALPVARQTVIGEGDLDFYRIFSMLKDFGYDGWYAPEYCAPESFVPYYERSQNNLQAIYEDVFGK